MIKMGREKLEISALKKKILNFRGNYASLGEDILHFEYQKRGLKPPTKNELVLVNKKNWDIVRESYLKGKFKCLFVADFKNFYPSIIREFTLQPKWDQYSIFLMISNRLYRIADANLGEDDHDKIKKFMNIFLYGSIGSVKSPYCDREFAATITSNGGVIIRKAMNLAIKAQPSLKIIQCSTDGFIANISEKNFKTPYITEAKRIIDVVNEQMMFNFIMLKFQGFYTQGDFKGLDTYVIKNQYNGERQYRPRALELYL